MPYASNRDRAPTLLELEKTPWPAPPLNVFVASGYQPGVFDLSWSNPSELSLNSRFQICGVNIYRSFDSEYGPFDRVNEFPIGTLFWRDETDNVLVLEEEVSDDRWILRGLCSGSEMEAPRYVFRTDRFPLVKEGTQATPANSRTDVEVTIDGVVANILKVVGETGEVEIDGNPHIEVGTQSVIPGTIPHPGSVVKVTYRYNRTLVRTDLGQRIFYRITTVGRSNTNWEGANPLELLETPLENATATSNLEIEKLDYIWTEAIRRNRWILQQGGERVKVFIRKHAGETCSCIVVGQKQPQNDCLLCYGTGFVGGYEGPYDILISPDDSEKRINHGESGKTLAHAYEVFAGPTPLLSQRDFIVKLNGDRYSVGSVRMPTNRGMLLQQHFNIGHIDEKDIRYKVPVGNPYTLSPGNRVRLAIPNMNTPAEITDKANIPDEREIRGRTITWENIMG